LTKKHDVETQDDTSLEMQKIPYLQYTLTIMRQAALLARRIQAEMISPALNKTDRSPVTVADFAIQALVARRLMETFSADPLVAEEDSSALKGSPLLDQVTGFVSSLVPDTTPQAVCEWIDRGHTRVGAGSEPVPTPAPTTPTIPARYWLLDPIDGTKGFLRGGQYAVALALMVDGRPQIGVLGCPDLQMIIPDVEEIPYDDLSHVLNGCLAFAVRDRGAWMMPLEGGDGIRPYSRLQVSIRRNPVHARLLRSFEAGHTNVDQIEQFAATLGIQTEPVLMDSQVKYAVLAAGQGDLMLRLLSPEKPDYREKAWDQAAGSLVVEEAGGRVTDLDGKPFDFSLGRELIHNRGVLVSNGRLHKAALLALKAIGA
jgi:3'(2'), 5'-bisphosphate nucleotidase